MTQLLGQEAPIAAALEDGTGGRKIAVDRSEANFSTTAALRQKHEGAPLGAEP